MVTFHFRTPNWGDPTSTPARGKKKTHQQFKDGTFDGTVVGHVVPVEADLSDEKWILEYTNGKQEAVRPQELLDLMVGPLC